MEKLELFFERNGVVVNMLPGNMVGINCWWK